MVSKGTTFAISLQKKENESVSKCCLVRIPLLPGGGVARSDGVVGYDNTLFLICYILPTTSPFGYSSSQEEENSVTAAF